MKSSYRSALMAAAVVGTFTITAIGAFAATQMLAGPRHAGPHAEWGFAQGPGPGGRMVTRGAFGLGFLRQLDLTDAQREQIRLISQQHRAEFQAVAERMRAARRALHEAITNEPANESLIRQRSAEVAEVETDAAVRQARLQAELLSVLTVEQRQRLDELRAERERRMEERRQRFEQRRNLRQQPPPAQNDTGVRFLPLA